MVSATEAVNSNDDVNRRADEAVPQALATPRNTPLDSPTDGGVAERLNAAVLKTARAQVLRGSNPLASATSRARLGGALRAQGGGRRPR